MNFHLPGNVVSENRFLINNVYLSIHGLYDKDYHDISRVNIKSYLSCLSKESFADGLIFFWDNMTHSCGIITPHMMRGQWLTIKKNLKQTLDKLYQETQGIPHILPHELYHLYFLNLCSKNCNAKFIDKKILEEILSFNQIKSLLDNYPQWFSNDKRGLCVTENFYLSFIQDMQYAQNHLYTIKGQ